MSVISSVSVHKAQKNGKQELHMIKFLDWVCEAIPSTKKTNKKLCWCSRFQQDKLCCAAMWSTMWVNEWPTDQTTSVQLTKDVCGMSFLSDGLELVVTPAILPVAVPRMLHHLENRHKHAVQPSSFLGVHPSQIRAFVSEKTPSWGWGFPAQRRVRSSVNELLVEIIHGGGGKWKDLPFISEN